MRMDFEVTDSIGKLERLGLLNTVITESGEKMLQVLGLHEFAFLCREGGCTYPSPF